MPRAYQRVAITSEIQYMRQVMLKNLVIPLLLLSWLWFSYLTLTGSPLGSGELASLLIIVTTLAAHRMAPRRYLAAATVMVAGLAAGVALVVVSYPSALAPSFGVVPIILASILLGTAGSLATTAIEWGAVAIASGAGGSSATWSSAEVLVLYTACWVACWLAERPLKASVEQTLSAWTDARAALAETRQQRGETSRAIYGLEQATYRLQRAVQELQTARNEADLARAQKARFAAIVSHELRGPLNVILGFSRMMVLSPERYDAPLPDGYLADLDAIFRNSEHLVALVDDVLDVSQIDAERLPLVKDRVDLERDVVCKAAGTVRLMAKRKGLYLREHLHGSLPWVLADQARLRQVILNLLTNAIRVTQVGGITVRTDLGADEVIITVEDTGPGISPQDQSSIFREFQRLPEEGGQSKGTGLGLNISKELVELHGGRMWLESTEGVGTCFHIGLPLPGRKTSGLWKRTDSVVYPSEDYLIVVNSDPAIVRLLARYTEAYRVVGIPEDVLLTDLVRRLHPKAVLTSRDQAAFVHTQLAQLQSRVPVISCEMPQGHARQGVEGTIGYISKPIRPEILAAVVAKVRAKEECTMLIVDDAPDAAHLLRGLLTALPYNDRILEAYDGAEAMATMNGIVPDIVFIDLVMPGISGDELIAQMRCDERLREVPVVIVSANDRQGEPLEFNAPIVVEWSGPINLSRWAKCVQELVRVVTPDYAAETESP